MIISMISRVDGVRILRAQQVHFGLFCKSYDHEHHLQKMVIMMIMRMIVRGEGVRIL